MKKFVMKPSGHQEIPVNPIGKLLRVLAILIYAGGFFYGAMWLSQSGVWFGAISVWFSAFLLGSVILGLAETVRLLHQICCREYRCAWEEVPEAEEPAVTEDEDGD